MFELVELFFGFVDSCKLSALCGFQTGSYKFRLRLFKAEPQRPSQGQFQLDATKRHSIVLFLFLSDVAAAAAAAAAAGVAAQQYLPIGSTTTRFCFSPIFFSFSFLPPLFFSSVGLSRERKKKKKKN